MITRIYAHNFRCLQNFSLDLAGRPSSLMLGKNGSGKSTVLKCLMLLQSIGRDSSRVSSLISASDFTRNHTDEPMVVEAELTLFDKKFKYAIAFDFSRAFRVARIRSEVLEVDGRRVFFRLRSKIKLAGAQSFGIDSQVFALPVINEPNDDRSIQELRNFFSKMILIAPIPANMSGFSESGSLELQSDASNYASCLRALLGQTPKAYVAFDSYLKAVIPDFSSIVNKERGERGTHLIVRFERSDDPLDLSVEFNALSDGEKCFFLSAYIVVANTVGPPVFCFWDEPDNHLSLSEVGHFIAELRKMTHRGGQFLATTHHPETIRQFSDESTLVLTRNSHLDPTVIRPLTELPHNGDLINALIRDEIIG